ncbi:hypothetical protein DL96DRAFT_1817240 [Flagelloscypha sp. PMI_526]|nr:hypothetical protein DL96DRAFT_1817240 [Flagelloscypha sp. PMI_526]
MDLPHDLLSVILSFCEKPTLAVACIINKAFCSEARAALYGRIFFSSPTVVERFLSCADHHLGLLKHLIIFISPPPLGRNSTWARLLSAVHQRSQLISLRISSNPAAGRAAPEFMDLVGTFLDMPCLEYVAITTRLVSAARAVRCLALKELSLNLGWEDSLGQETTIRLEHDKPMLNTLCHDWQGISVPLLRSLFNLNILTRLAVNQREWDSPVGIILLLAETCRTLQEVSLWIYGAIDRADIAELRTLVFPNLRALILFHTPEVYPGEEHWEMCQLLVPLFLSISPRLRELRFYFHNVKPSNILISPSNFIPTLDPRILVLRLTCWIPGTQPAKTIEGEKFLRDQCGPGRDFEVDWISNWTVLTPFCRLVETEWS